ncbi:MAG: hypothetical protein ACXWQJ_09955 [Bdellovibrionota bacterium]
MAEKQKNQIIVIEPITKTVNDLLEAILAKDLAIVSPFKNAEEAIQCARQFEPCMLVLCIQNNNDIPPILNTLKKLKTDIKQGLVKTLLVSKIKNAQLQKLIGEFGVTDYIEEPIAARSLMFKANLQLKAVDTTRRQIEQRKLADEKIVFKSSKKGEDEAQSLGGEMKMRQRPALQLANDTFLIKNSAVKKQAKKFVVELDGPDPSTGEWIPEGEDPANPAWRWKPHDKEDEPGSEEGDGWVSNGDKPQFKATAKKWQISSEKPSLFFKKKNLKVAEKIGVDEDGEVTVAEDSPAAEENLRKNLAKVQIQKKKKLADAAGIPIVEEEEKAKAVAPLAPAEVKEEEKEELDPVAQARKKARLAKAAKSAPDATTEKTSTEPETEAEEDAETGSGGRKKLEQLRKAREARKKAALAAGVPVEPGDVEQESAPKVEPELDSEDEQESDPLSPMQKKEKEKEAGPKAESQLLNFLKKKKGVVAKAEEAGEEPAAGAEPEATEAGADIARLTAIKKKQAEKKAKAKSEEQTEALEEDAPKVKAGPTPKEEAEAEPKTELKFAEQAEEEEEHSEPAFLAKERRRKRAEKKKALLKEIQAESEPSAKEVETIERKRKAKAEGIEIEEEPEDEKPRTERLESLRKKREELEAIDKESEEEEKDGISLHTQQAEEQRGMNVWDTDESVEADGPSEKLLKKLKKEKREKAEAAAKEKGESGENEEAVDFADSGPSLKKKKKKSGTSSQADGLEDIFSEQEEAEGEELSAKKGDPETESDSEAEAPAGESRTERLDRLRKQRDQAKSEPESEPEAESISETTAEERGSSPDSVEENSENSAEKISAKEEAPEKLLEKSAKKEFAEAEAVHLTDKTSGDKTATGNAEELLKKKGEKSESMKRFLERRKQKKETEEAEALTSKKNEESSTEAGQKRSFLGIFVAISDSFGVASERKLLNIFRAFESALENCAVALTLAHEGNAPLKVLFASSLDKGAEIPAAECRIETFLDSQEQPVALLALRMLAPRTDFAEDESEAIKRAMRALKPLVMQWLANAEKEKAA